MLDVAGEQIAEIERLDVTSHQPDCVVRDAERGVDVCRSRRGRHQIDEDFGPSLGAHLDDEPVLVTDELGEREVEPALCPRPRSHGGAEAGAARNTAVDGDEEGVLPSRRVVTVDVRPLEEDPVLDRDCVQIAGADAEQRERPLGRSVLDELRVTLVVAASLPQAHARGQQPSLPRLWPDGIPEPRLVVTPFEAIGSCVLDLRPPRGQLVGRRDLLVDDRAFPACRTDDAVPAIPEYADERMQAVEIDHGRCGMRQERLLGHQGQRGFCMTLTHRCSPGTVCGNPAVRPRHRRLRDAALYVSLNGVSQALAVERLRLHVRGVVQGVGFRPFVHRLAHRYGLSGFVLNDADGVVVEVEGDPSTLAAFVGAIATEAPPLARIAGIDATACLPRFDSGFAIVRSEGESSGRTTLVAPDAATCDDCLRELFDPADRRYRYPFVNCTNCGPRFTIVTSVPYDRPRTTMAGFPLCAACRSEYEDPGDRRFHAEPIACPDCGPRLTMPLEEASGLLLAGRIVAVKGLGGYHLACDATNEQAVARLRSRKHREEKPLAVMTTAPHALADVTFEEDALLRGPERPIVLVRQRADARIAPSVSAGSPWLGLMLPYTPLHHLLCRTVDRPLVLTSGNRSDEPIAIDDEEARRRLGEIADAFLSHDRPIHRRCEDSVVRAAFPVRRSRGHAPGPLRLPVAATAPIVAAGAELKSTFCVARGFEAFLSPHLGDLDSEAAYAAFRADLALYLDMLGVTPVVVACDLHPEYLSTKWAHDQGLPIVEVQHHHAHAAACLAEHGEADEVLAVVLDGTGMGTDGTLWGGEILRCDLVSFERVAHLEPVPVPGGETAIREPWRMAAAYLERAGRPVPFERWPLVRESLKVNAPLSSGAGRLFDAVSALLGLRETVSYEGQAAIELEQLAGDTLAAPYPCSVDGDAIRGADLVAAAFDDVAAGRPRSEIAAAFHEGVAAAFAAACSAAGRPGTVALSGGSFQNLRLLASLSARLEDAGFRVLSHRLVPPNDGGVSYGQAAVAAATLGAS